MYPSFSRWPLLLGLLSPGYLNRLTTAQTCRGTFEVTRPEDVQSLFQNCTHVIGDIIITHTYSGPFVLPNITTIDGNLELQWVMSQHPQLDNSLGPRVTSVELPDTTAISNMRIANITTLKNVSMPQLTTVGQEFSIYQHHLVTDTVDIPLLQDVSHFYLAGGISSVNVDSLRNVSEYLDIYGPGADPRKEDTADSLDITFPSLQYAGRVLVDGRVSSISMPELKSLGKVSSYGGYSDDVRITVKDTPASFNFSGLQNLTGSFQIHGPVKSLDLSSLQRARVYMLINTSYPLKLSLPLRTAESSITLSGAIESVEFPNLKEFSSISIHSNLHFGCKNFTRDMDEIARSFERTTKYDCSEPHPKSPVLGLIALCVVPVAAIAGAWYLRTKRSYKEDNGQKPKWAERPLSPIQEHGSER